jgi:hypothetical protein
LRFWDDAQNEFAAELAFLERELPIHLQTVHEESAIETRLSVGAWMNGLNFDATTPVGRRKLKSGTMGTVQLSLACNVLDPIFFELSGEYAQGKDASITTFGIDLGARLYRGSLLLGEGEVRIQAGFLLSTLTVDEHNFGNFDMGTGYRAGISARAELTDHLSLDACVQYRSFTYKWSEDIISGDDKASAGGVAILLGITWRF